MCSLYRGKKEGFTLIELLIVVAIIAILTSIGIPSLLGTRKAGNEATAIATLKSITSAEETFKSRNLGGDNEYGSLQELVAAKAQNFPHDNGDGTYMASAYVYSTVAVSATDYGIKAEPLTEAAGSRSFAVTTDGYVREKASSTIAESTVAALQGLSVVAR